MTPCQRAAHWYADRLGPVFPCSRSKIPLTRHGVLDASRDHAQIDAWWRRWPGANVALACTTLLAVDIDPRHGGDVTLDGILAERGPLPDTVEQLTPGGGRHLLFNAEPGLQWKKQLGVGIDIQAGAGKYILVAPSIHPNGRQYIWELSSRPDEVLVAEPPPWLLMASLRFEPQAVHVAIGAAATSYLARAFAAAGWVIRPIDEIRIAVRCPWQRLHTSPTAAAHAVVFAPTERSPDGRFFCSHQSHGRKTYRDVIEALPGAALAAAIRTTDDDVEREAIRGECA